MISVPSTMTFPARGAVIDLAPEMGGAYGPSIRSLTARSMAGLGDEGDTGFDWSNLFKTITAGAGAATSVINATRLPYVVPGTANVVYNPATGQAMTPVGTTVQQGLSGVAPWIALGVAVLALGLVAMRK